MGANMGRPHSAKLIHGVGQKGESGVRPDSHSLQGVVRQYQTAIKQKALPEKGMSQDGFSQSYGVTSRRPFKTKQ